MKTIVMLAALAVFSAVIFSRPVSAETPATAAPPAHEGAVPMDHEAHMRGSSPTMPGQDAFGAVAEIVRILDADPDTDWSKVDLERLRQHLIDMNEVVLGSRVKQTPIPSGLSMDVTGTGRTARAIRAMVIPHAAELNAMEDWSAKAAPIRGGVRLIVTAKKPDDARAVARLRGLGFIGLLTAGAHHGPHHLAMARGERVAHAH
jgi:hypothetical protein